MSYGRHGGALLVLALICIAVSGIALAEARTELSASPAAVSRPAAKAGRCAEKRRPHGCYLPSLNRIDRGGTRLVKPPRPESAAATPVAEPPAVGAGQPAAAAPTSPEEGVSGGNRGSNVPFVPVEEEPPAQEPPAGEPPAGEPPAGEPPAGEPPVQEPPAEEPPAGEEPPAEEPPVQEPPAEEPPVEEPPVEEPPAEEPPAGEPPAGQVLFSDDFNSIPAPHASAGGWYLQCDPGRASVANGVARFEVQPGDIETDTGSPRCELSNGGPDLRAGDDVWVYDKFRWGADDTATPPWELVDQWHDGGPTGGQFSPPLALFRYGNTIRLINGNGGPVYWQGPAVQRGVWQELLYHFQPSPTNGHLEAWW
ncbi:MAG TPA: hypothetical protein VGI73_03220, partial [Solirubrobacterales bacterium]